MLTMTFHSRPLKHIPVAPRSRVRSDGQCNPAGVFGRLDVCLAIHVHVLKGRIAIGRGQVGVESLHDPRWTALAGQWRARAWRGHVDAPVLCRRRRR